MARKNIIQWETENDEGDEVVEELPAKYAVCSRCRGEGSHVNPAIDGHGLSREDFDEDPDFEEAYFEGRYDVTCHECKGERVVLELDEETAGRECPELLERYIDFLKDEAEYDAICAAERRMGA
jgi:hypothetical protein